jgi:GDPmannose 4,6-dehydratase
VSGKVDMITGCTGQDGALLAKHLVNQGRKVIGLCRKSSDLRNLSRLMLFSDPGFSLVRLNNKSEYLELFQEHGEVDNFFHFAGFSSVGKSFQMPDVAYQANLALPIQIANSMLEAKIGECTFWQASSAYIFDCGQPIDWDTPYRTISPYASSKCEALAALKSIFYSTSIHMVAVHWFNHTGSFSNENFVIPKIMTRVAEGLLSGKKEVVIPICDQEVRRDWGVADRFMGKLAGSLDKKFRAQQGRKSEIFASSGINASIREILDEISIQCGLSIIVNAMDGSMRNRPWDPKNVSISHECASSQALSFEEESLHEVVRDWLTDFTGEFRPTLLS